MPNLTTPFLHLGGTDINKDMDDVQNWSISLIDELKYILCNLDAGNCQEASKVKAQNIDCSKARIHNAQIQSLTADKLTAGTIDAEEIDVINMKAGNIATGTLDISDNVSIGGKNAIGRVKLDSDALVFFEKIDGREYPRIAIGRGENGKYVFTVQNLVAAKGLEVDENENKAQGIYMDSDGNIYITGHFTGGSISSETDININKDASIGQALYLKDINGENGAKFSIGGITSRDSCEIHALQDRHLYLSSNNQVIISADNDIEITTDGNINLKGKSIKINGRNILNEIDDIKNMLIK